MKAAGAATSSQETFAVPVAGGDTSTPRNLAKRLALIKAHVPASARMLDAGCGAGEYVIALGKCGYEVRGVEFQEDKIARWQAEHSNDDRVTQGDIERLPFADAHFDAVLLNEVLEHVPDQAAALAEAFRVLRSNGKLLVFSPNRRYPFETHGVYTKAGRFVPPIKTFLLPYLPLQITLKIVSPWARNYWPHELRQEIANAGFTVIEQDYVWQTFENISGLQGPTMRALSPVLRACAAVMEHAPLLRSLGTSQVVVAVRR